MAEPGRRERPAPVCPVQQVIEQVLGGALFLPPATFDRLCLDRRRDVPSLFLPLRLPTADSADRPRGDGSLPDRASPLPRACGRDAPLVLRDSSFFSCVDLPTFERAHHSLEVYCHFGYTSRHFP